MIRLVHLDLSLLVIITDPGDVPEVQDYIVVMFDKVMSGVVVGVAAADVFLLLLAGGTTTTQLAPAPSASPACRQRKLQHNRPSPSVRGSGLRSYTSTSVQI